MTAFEIIMALIGAAISFGFGLLAYYIHDAEKKREGRESTRDQNMLYLVNCCSASMDLSDAVAISMINGKCNGEIEAARIKANKVKCDYRDFLTAQGIQKM